MIQWIGFILVEVIATTPFATTRSPLMLSICVIHVTSDLRPAISTSSKGQKWRDNGSSIYHQHVAATTLVSLLKAFPQKVSPFLFSCVPYQLQVASIFFFLELSDRDIVSLAYYDVFHLQICLYHQLVELFHLFPATNALIFSKSSNSMSSFLFLFLLWYRFPYLFVELRLITHTTATITTTKLFSGDHHHYNSTSWFSGHRCVFPA